MKAIRVHEFGGPEVLRFEDVPDPEPGPGQVVLRVEAIGVNPVDTYVRAGTYGPRSFPFTPGSDAAGVIDAVGPGVRGLKPGNRVYTSRTESGAYAERVLAAEASVHPLPASVSTRQGAAVGTPAATAYVALFHRGRVQPGETVLVHGGSGGVGIAALQLARAWGATLIATAGTERGQKLALENGAHHVVDHRAPGEADAILARTEGRGVDLILEMLANQNLATDLRLLARGGRVVVIGSRGRIEIDPRDTMSREADVRGMSLLNAQPDDLRRVHAALFGALEQGVLRPIVGAELPLREAPRAHHAIIEGTAYGKLVLVP
jgi:NADPH2:quinone reductase